MQNVMLHVSLDMFFRRGCLRSILFFASLCKVLSLPLYWNTQNKPNLFVCTQISVAVCAVWVIVTARVYRLGNKVTCGLDLQAQELNPQLVKRTRFLKPVKLGGAELWTTVGFCVPAHWLTRDSPGGLTYCSSCRSVSAALQPPHKPPNLTSRWAPTLEWRHTKLNASLNAWSAHMQE